MSEPADGAMNASGLIWGTYIHGVFDEPDFRAAWLNRIRARKGLPLVSAEVSRNNSAMSRREVDRWADHLARHLDMQPLWRALNHGAGR
jgi:adenosylcobyric acid synthase